jgi:beta-lactamase superfamily II metal-dependent hydrolase
MATKKKSRKTSRRGTGSNGHREIVIRMYNVGFGDAFLVQIPDGARTRRMLFDCGSIEAAPDRPMKDVVDEIITDARDADGTARIDVVIATHRHKDHVSGFANAAWADVEVQEVWMPWTEDPIDPEARRIRNVQSQLTLSLQRGLQARLASPGAAAALTDLQRAIGIVENALMLSNDAAMKTLHNGFAGDAKRRFLPKDGERTFTTGALPGVTVHMMGPSHSDDVIRDMDPPKGKSYLRMSTLQLLPEGASPSPFSHEFVQQGYSGTMTSLTADEIDAIQRAGSLSDLAVAVALDKAVNGTSLMLMLEVAGTHLLFPGDAQWGTWQAALADPQWREMLKQTGFYKIGHHGSHNATPPDFVEDLLPTHTCAMASTRTRKIWPDIPRIPLLDALTRKQTNVARSDAPVPAGGIFTQQRAGTIEARIPL